MIKRFAMLATLIALMAFMGIGTASAQGSVENYTFPAQAEWLDESYFARIGGSVNARSIPTDQGNSPRFTFAPGSTVEVTATVDTGTHNWLLVRGWDTDGYIGSGWVQETAARLTRIETLDTPALPACHLNKASNDQEYGEPMNVDIRFNAGWTHDAMSTSCNLFYEGRVQETQFHNYWIVRDANAAGTATITTEDYLTNGFMWLLEGGAWIHPTDWSMGNGFRTGDTGQTLEFPPMVSYFAQDKQQVMAREGYRWPFVIYMVDGTQLDFAYGAFGTTSNAVDRCELTQPREMSITGIYISETGSFRSTSVGAEGCATIIFWQLPDGTYQLFGLVGTDENLEYKFVYSAYLIPSDWDGAEIGEFVMDEIVANARVGTKIEVVGIDGMSDFTR